MMRTDSELILRSLQISDTNSIINKLSQARRRREKIGFGVSIALHKLLRMSKVVQKNEPLGGSDWAT